jgi:hypothetical protein
VVLEGDHYIAIGEHADLWVGHMSDNRFFYKKVQLFAHNLVVILTIVSMLGCGESSSRRLVKQSRFSGQIQRSKLSLPE